MARSTSFKGEPDKRILILGGGFLGVYTALGLERALRPEDRTLVTLISNENFFLFTPMLPEIASSRIGMNHAISPLRKLFRRTHFAEGEVRGIDVASRQVRVRHLGGRELSYPYDHLVLALGATTGFFGMEDVEEHALTTKTLGDALFLRNRMINLLEQAAVEPDAELRRELLTFVIAGGGLTGVEIAGEINDLVRDAARSYPGISQRTIRVLLVEALPRLMPELSEDLADFALRKLRAGGVEVLLNTRVGGADATHVYLQGHEPLPCRSLIWASGMTPHPLLADLPFPRDGRGWLVVDETLRIAGFPGVWSGGDLARVPDILRPGKSHPATAQHAIREGDRLARNIAAAIRGQEPRPFQYETLGQMAIVGHHNGVGIIGKPGMLGFLSPIKVWGRPGWWLWRIYYLARLPRIEKRLRVLVDWMLDGFFGRDISQIKTDLFPHHTYYLPLDSRQQLAELPPAPDQPVDTAAAIKQNGRVSRKSGARTTE